MPLPHGRACPKPRPRILEKRDAQRDAERVKRAVYKAVAERDQYRCRCCGRKGQYDATVAAHALHRHHLTYRSKGGEDSPRNLLTLCAFCHALEHAKQLLILGENAERAVTFEILEAAVVEVFGAREVPRHVKIVAPSRRRA